MPTWFDAELANLAEYPVYERGGGLYRIDHFVKLFTMCIPI